jgi:hypothetical protein
MSGETSVSVADLRTALSRLLDEVERRQGSIVDLDADYYWTVHPMDAFRFEAEAPKPTVGELADDIRSMQSMLVDQADSPIVVWHDLAHLIGILNRLAALDHEL